MRYLFILASLLFCFSCSTKMESQKSKPLETTSYFTVSSGTVQHIDSFPSENISKRHVEIWLPESYDANKKYPVIYFHDGQNLFDSTKTWNKQEWMVDEVMGKLMKENKIREAIVVGVWNTVDGRFFDYFPRKPFDKLPDDFKEELKTGIREKMEKGKFSGEPRSDDYLKFLVEELKPYIDTHYPTQKDRENTFLAGSSMGGLISMYGICEYPAVFGGAACLSTHWIGTFDANTPIPQTFINYLGDNLPDPKTHKIYFDYGTESLDAYYEPFQLQADSVMKANGFDSSNWMTKKFEGDGHLERAWQKRLHIPMEFLLGK